MAMLDRLEDRDLVAKAAEEVGQVLVWGVEGQLGEGHAGDRTPCECVQLLCLLSETGVTPRHQHVQGVVEVLRWSSKRRQRGKRRHLGGGEGQSAS